MLKIFIVFSFFIVHMHADEPVFVLLTHARATATAFEKVIRTKENIEVLHAPFIVPYLLKKYGTNHPLTRPLPDPTVTFGDVTNKLFALAKHFPVFLKESGYLLVDYFKEHPEFYQNPQVKIVFLVRDPAKSILSFYRRLPTVDESIVGHRQLWELFELLREQQIEVPLVIDSDEFLKDPLFILKKLGTHWGIQFDETNLKWESGYAEDWHLKDWYVDVATSTGLGPFKGDIDRDEDGTPSYLEVADEKDRRRLQELYRTQNIYYQKLLQYAIKAQN